MSQPPNIVWLTLDSLRYDHTTMSDYWRDTTPHLNSLATEGHSFSQCIAHSNFTLASAPSILTGTYPSYHGVGMGINDRLPNSIETIAELLSTAGYHTGCISEIARVSDATGLDRGFDTFHYTFDRSELDHFSEKVRALESHLRGNVLPNVTTLRHDRRGITNGFGLKYTTEMARSYVDSVADGPFFLYLHAVGPHYPYRPPASCLTRYTDDVSMDPAAAVEFAMEIYGNDESVNRAISEGCPFTDDEWDALRALYDAEIAYADACVGHLIDDIRDSLDGDTVFVITSDHGDLFGERDLIAHKLVLHDGLVRVPLVTHGLDAICDVDPETPIQHADLMKTFVSEAGGDTESLHGVDLRSERRAAAITQLSPNEPTFASARKYNPDFDTDRFHATTATAVRTSEFKYEHSNEKRVLYELPDEETDVSHDNPNIVDELEQIRQRWMDVIGDPVVADQDAEFTDRMEQQLEDLGYL